MKKLISIRVSPETDNQINRLKDLDNATQAAVIARAVNLYFEKRVDAEMAERLRGIPFEAMGAGKTYLLQVDEDGTVEIIAPQDGEVEDSRSRRVYKNGRFVEKVWRDGKLVKTIKGVEGEGKK